MIIIDGKRTAGEIRQEIARRVAERKSRNLKIPHLAAILVGSNGASITYVNAKVKDCQDVGFDSTLIDLPENTTEEELLQVIDNLNHDTAIDGYIIQLPLPKHINEQRVLLAVNPDKDVDGFHPQSVGKLALGLPTFISATPMGIVELLKRYNIETSGKHCVVIGRSNIVGKPMSLLMSRNDNPGNCTVTMAHSRTQNIKDICRQADIVIAAIGKAGFVTADMVKPGATVIDVGITRVEDSTKKKGYRLLGDVAFDEVAHICHAITPVPGGVGPMTRAALLLNTLQAVEFRDVE